MGKSLPGPNQDTGALSRVAAAVAYLLPLLDGLRFGLPVVDAFPSLEPALYYLLGPAALLSSVPFLQVFIFIALQVYAGLEELPALVRFNVKLAVLLDAVLFLPSIVSILLHFFGQGRVPEIAG